MRRLQAALALALSLLWLVPTGASALTIAPTDSFDSWLDKEPSRGADVRAFEAFLAQQGVAGVLPTREILLNDTDWSECHMDGPYSLAERAYWPHIVNTLRYIHDEIIPAIGPVRVASGYRDADLNRCSGGAAHSAHAQFYALDLTPIRNMDRSELIERVCANHARYGAAYHIGLGFYEETRFHLDSRSFRRWGADYHAASSPCARTGILMASRSPSAG
jgi:hypothetical protein